MKIVVVSHTHWDREWYQPAEVFRLRLAERVGELCDVLDRDLRFAHFMLDGQTVCVDDVLAVRPSLRPRLAAHLASGRIGIGPWYVLQDELLVGAESIVRNLAEGMRAARAFGTPMAIGYLPDAFGHIAQMPRILRGFQIETAVVWRGVGDRAPGSEWRWRALDGSEVLCLFLPGGYGNAAKLGSDETVALRRLDELIAAQPASRAGVHLWMNGTDHLPIEPQLPDLLGSLRRARPALEIEHATLERAAEQVRERVEVAALDVVEGELLRATPDVPVLSGTWSTRSWQKRDHDEAQALLVRFAEPFVAIAGADRREALRHAWRLLLRCQPHDSICGCSTDEVHREIATRLSRVRQLATAIFKEAVHAILDAPTADFAVHEAIAIVNPHPFSVDASVEVEVQRLRGDPPFRLMGPLGEVGYEQVSRWPSESPDRRPTEWLRLRVAVNALPAHGLRTLAIVPGAPTAITHDSPLELRVFRGGIELVDAESGTTVEHTFEDEDDRGDLYDFCPTGSRLRSSRAVTLGGRATARAIGRRVEVDLVVDNQRRDHRLRARFALASPPSAFTTETSFGWIERTTPGTHPVAAITTVPGVAFGGAGLHEVERGDDGALRLTLLRAVGWMSRGDLSTRKGHAGYALPTPEAQGLGPQRYRYVIAFGPDATRGVDAGMIPPLGIPLAAASPGDRALLSIEPASVRLSIWKRAEEGDEHIVRLCGPPKGEVIARLLGPRPLQGAWRSDLDERVGDPIAIVGNEIAVPIAAGQVVTLRLRF